MSLAQYYSAVSSGVFFNVYSQNDMVCNYENLSMLAADLSVDDDYIVYMNLWTDCDMTWNKILYTDNIGINSLTLATVRKMPDFDLVAPVVQNW